MEKYGGKFQKRREETMERHLREKEALVKKICVYSSLLVWLIVGLLLGSKYYVARSWNEDLVYKTRAIWKALDLLEADIMDATLFLKIVELRNN